MRYRILYDTSEGVKDYTVCAMDINMARQQLSNFKEFYLNEDGTPKPFPNGRGHYDVANPRIVPQA